MNSGKKITKYRRRQIWRSVFTTLAAIVVFVTTYALIIPAITWERTLICELEEHVHTDNCYNSKGQLKCGKIEHKHTDECFDAPKAVTPLYICGKTEHVHTEDCYFSDGTMRCTVKEHTHTDACLYANRLLLMSQLSAPLGEKIPANIYTADPDTSDLLTLFKPFSADYDGMVLVDKSVFEVNSRDKFNVVLSALGQSYTPNIPIEEYVHPDVVFVVDISTSMARSQAGSSGVSRLAAVIEALNNGINQLLEQDPQTRIGIVSYSDYVWDGTRDGDGNFLSKVNNNYKHFYLPLAHYEYMGSDFKYVNIDETGYGGDYVQGGSSPAHVSFNTNWHRINFTSSGSKTAADGFRYNVGTAVDESKTSTIRGTYTQDGLLGGVRMFETISQEDKSKREPVLVLITDGEPTRFSEYEVYDASSPVRHDDGGSSNTTHCGYWTVRTAMYAKKQINKMYADAGNTHGIIFDTIGPGVTSLYGGTVINPSPEKLEACRTGSGGASDKDRTAAYNLYYDLMVDSTLKLSDENVQYADFADYSLAGDLTPQDIKDGMEQIIASLRVVSRPIITDQITTHHSIIDTDSLVTFIDKLGKDMEITGMPSVSYGSTTVTGTVAETGTLASDDEYSSDYSGRPYTLYEFSGTAIEESTNKIMDFSEILLYEITDEDGSTVMLWQFTDNLLPVIYHDPGVNLTDTSDDSLVESDPLRLHFTVQPVGGTTVPGETYYSNSTSEPTVCHFNLAEDNPYYTSDRSDSAAKSENQTETLADSSDYSQSVSKMSVILGNNGKLETPLNLSVHKTWNVSGTHPSSVTVHLLRNGTDTGKSVTLSDSNNWAAQFEGNLAKYDADGDLIVYSVREDVPEDYTVTGENDEPHIVTYETGSSHTEPAHWQTVTSMKAGEIYRIHFGNSSANVLRDYSGELTVRAPSSGTTTAREQWKVVNDGGTFRLQNVQSNSYLRINNDADTIKYSTNTDTAFALISNNGNRYIQLTRGGNTRYLRVNNSTISVVQNLDYATSVTVEQLIPEETVSDIETVELYGFELVNKAEELTVSAEKIWGTGTTRVPVTLQIYEKKSGTVTPKGTMILNSSGNWNGTYTLSPVSAGAVYYIAEVTTGDFFANYDGAPVEMLTYGGKSFPAVRLDVQHEVKIEVINNAIGDQLPGTGGSGIRYIYVIGGLLMAISLMIGHILWRRRERRSNV